MSADHEAAVRQSDLYEYKGLAKPLLTRIAGLILPKELPPDDPWKPYEGWCITSQDTLAAMLGCSTEQVNRLINRFVQDGWLTAKEFRDERGYPRCHYTMTGDQLKAVQARKMKKDENGDYVREKNPKQSRKDKAGSQANLVWKRKPGGQNLPADTERFDDPSKSLLTNRQEPICHNVKKPLDESSIQGSPSFKSGQGRKQSSSCPADFKPTKEGKKEMGRESGGSCQAVDSPESPAPGFLEEKTVAALRQAGCPDGALALMSKLEHYASKLNNTTNVVTTYLTLVGKDNGVARRLSAIWLPDAPRVSRAAAAVKESRVNTPWGFLRSIDDVNSPDYIPDV